MSKRLPSQSIQFEAANPQQEAYIWETRRHSLIDGGIGSGKSVGLIMKALILVSEFPGCRGAICRQEYKYLTATTRKTFYTLCPPAWIKRDIKELTEFVNGSEILWLHLDVESENSLRGLELNWAGIDQLEEVKPEVFDVLDSRLGRWKVPEVKENCPPYMFCTSNPNGRDWVYYFFCPEVIGEKQKDRAYFFVTTYDNAKILGRIDPTYIPNLETKSDAFKNKWLWGRRDISEGTIFPEFKPDVHVYDPRFFSPYVSASVSSAYSWFDYGLTSPTCCLVSVSSIDETHFITDEYYEKDRLISEHAAAIQKLLGRCPVKMRATYADPSCFVEATRDRKVMTTSIAQEYRTHGLYMLKADNGEASSIANLHEMLHIDPKKRNPVTGRIGGPSLFISKACSHLIQELQMQRHLKVRNLLTGEMEFSEERDPNIPDHAVDPLRYFANSKLKLVPAFHGQPKVPYYYQGATNRKQRQHKGYQY